MNKTLLFVCTFLLVSVSAFAQLDDIEFDGSNYLRFDNGRDVDQRRIGATNPDGSPVEYPDNTIARRFVEDRLRLDLFSGNYHLGGRFLYFKPAESDVDQLGLVQENRFDKRFFEGQIHPLKFRFGHFSDIWASGLTFSSFENRDLYFDSELDGARVQVDAGSIKLIGLTGKTAQGPLVNELTSTAGRIQLSPGAEHLGFSYAYNDSGFYSESSVAGVDWNFTRGIFNLYGERAWNEMILQGGNSNGHATFVGVTVSKWGWSLLAQYADYAYNQVTPMQNPPTTYREVGPRLLQSRDPHVLNIPDEVGVQAELSGSIGENTFVMGHYNANSHHNDEDESIPLPKLEEKFRPFWEMFGNVEHYFDGGQEVYVEVGANEEAATEWQKRLWTQVRANFPFKGSQEIEFETEQLFIKDKLKNDEKYHDMLYSVSWVPNRSFSINAAVQFTDDEALQKREGNQWISGEAAWKFSGGKHRAILFYGSERGGLKCSNGVCRQVQAFSGLRLTLETSL